MINRERESVEEILGGQVELPPSGGREVRQGAKGKHLTDTILDLFSKGFVTTNRSKGWGTPSPVSTVPEPLSFYRKRSNDAVIERLQIL